MKKIIDKLQQKVSNPNLLNQLDSLSQSELNTLLLEVFKNRSIAITPGQVLDAYANNRFVTPSDIDPVKLRETELNWLKLAKLHQFEPIVLSPLAPLGSCSAIAHVDQNNVISALRGTEVISDATNVLALQLSKEFKDKLNDNLEKHYVAVHRHTRGQTTDNPKFSPHFSTLCLASGGRDMGNFEFELGQLHHHLSCIYEILLQEYSTKDLSLTFYCKKNGERLKDKLKGIVDFAWADKSPEYVDDLRHDYYKLLQFKIFIHKNGQTYNIADGGFVDWTQRLLSNKKQRCIISGIGIELFHRL